MRLLTLAAVLALLVPTSAAAGASELEAPDWPFSFKLVADFLTLGANVRPPQLLTLLTTEAPPEEPEEPAAPEEDPYGLPWLNLAPEEPFPLFEM